MIYLNKNILYMLICLLACVACSEETLISQKVEEDIPVTASLSFQSSDPGKIETRATDLDEDSPVKSLAIFIFKKNNGTSKRVGDVHFCTKEELESKKITIQTTSGERYIYAIANYHSSLFQLTEEDLNNITTIDGLADLHVTLPENNISVLDNLFLMSGCVMPDEVKDNYAFDRSCTIDTNGKVSGRLLLTRIMASIQFTINSRTEKGRFTPSSWQIKRVPKQSNVFEQKSSDYDEDDAVYFSSKVDVNFAGEDKNQFSFLMLENRKAPKASESINTYDERERQGDTKEVFTAANKNSTYVVLKGTFSGVVGSGDELNDYSGKKVEAYTTYYIHLGDWSTAGNGGSTNYRNFNIFRNNRYKYTVTVNGVDNLVVEVTTDKELWGGDGNMYVSDSEEIESFDAHYGTTIISFDKKKIRDLIAANKNDKTEFKKAFKIQAATPKNGFDLSGKVADIDWVTYKRNTGGPDKFMKYKDAESDEPLTADQFKDDLYEAVTADGTDGFIYYTCFIDEYYYGDLELSKFINVLPRTIQIGTDYTKNQDPSSSSSISKAAYIFTQKSISTVYDLDKLDEDKKINGWGAEWVQEGNNLQPIEGTNPNHTFQGRSNMWGHLQNKSTRWSDYIDFENNEMNDGYNCAQYACLNRNRDLNGNGVIDKDELRWYLPAINQYAGFFLGADALPDEVRLYNKNVYDINFLYISSTELEYKNNKSDFRVFWANEGCSTGFYTDPTSTSTNASASKKQPYRCIRNLRSVTADVTDFVTPSSEISGDHFKYITFDYLNPVAKRPSVNQALTPGHTNFDEENRLSNNGIEIMGRVEKTDIHAGDASTTNVCVTIKRYDKKWRLPNQRELFIITSYMPIVDGNSYEKESITSCTKSAFPPSGESDRIYFVYKGGKQNVTMKPFGDWSFFRCISDKY